MTPFQSVKISLHGLSDRAFDVSLLRFASFAVQFVAALARLRCPRCDKVQALKLRDMGPGQRAISALRTRGLLMISSARQLVLSCRLDVIFEYFCQVLHRYSLFLALSGSQLRNLCWHIHASAHSLRKS